MVIGRPSSGRASPAPKRRSAAAASVRARSGISVTTAFSRGFTLAMRARCSSTSSVDEISRARSNASRRVAVANNSPSLGMHAIVLASPNRRKYKRRVPGGHLLLLLRHGIAEDAAPGETDASRRLTGEGKRKLREVAAGMRALD